MSKLVSLLATVAASSFQMTNSTHGPDSKKRDLSAKTAAELEEIADMIDAKMKAEAYA